MPDSSLLQALRAGTERLHRATEAHPRMAALMQPGLTRAAYRHTLEALYGFHAPVESMLTRAVPAAFPDFSMARRGRVDALEQDLRALGTAPRTLRRMLPPQRPSGPAEVLGWLYVVEGSTLGGRLLCRRLEPRLHFGTGPGLRFFRGYGDDTGDRWRELLSLLARYDDAQPTTAEPVVDAARLAFSMLHSWLDQYDAVRRPYPEPA